MKHAFLIVAHHQFEILEKMMELLDDDNCAFFINIDKKCKRKPEDKLMKCCKKSEVHFIERMSVNWGGYSQIECTLRLMKAALGYNYDYYHLLSGVDFPIKTKQEILSFFDNHPNTQFVQCSPTIQSIYLDRLKYHSVFQDCKCKKLQFIDRVVRKTERIMGYSRLKNETRKFQFGSNWFSITKDFAQYVIQEETWIKRVFRNTRCGDELFIQTMLINSPYLNEATEHLYDASIQANLRFIDFNRGNPYIFQKEDFEELLFSPVLFARKFDLNKDSQIVEMLFKQLQ